MSDTYKVRVGVSSARELEFEVSDPDALSQSFEKAVKKGDPVLWIDDVRGQRFGIATSSIAFVQVERPEERGVGFGPS
ncbi:MAG: DUF3107 family protein [Acidimicrobiia bacterium]